MAKGVKRRMDKAFREEAIRLHGDACLNCGDRENVEWHHVVPLELGGNDIPSNTVPLCHICHKTVTFQQLLLQTTCRESCKNGGRPKKQWVNNAEDIFEDYVYCRISKLEAKERLGVGYNFCDHQDYRDWLKGKHIAKTRNNIDTYMSSHKWLIENHPVGWIQFDDGTREIINWHSGQECLSGKSIVPTGRKPNDIPKRTVSLDVYREIVACV